MLSILCSLLAKTLALSMLIPFLPIAIRLLVLSVATVAIFSPDFLVEIFTLCNSAGDKIFLIV